MAADLVIEGQKKGGSSGGSESKDTLRSVQTAQLVDLICEGEIEGLVNGLKSVYLDGVPVKNPDGSDNFEGLVFGFQPGTQGQGALPGFDAVQSEHAVGVEVRAATPIVRTIVSSSVDSVRVTISVPQLTKLDTSSGNLTGATFTYAIEVQSAGGGYVEKHRETISDKTTSLYKRATRLVLSGSAPWDIKVRRINADSTASTLVDAFFWDSYTEIQSVALRYPNSAAAGLQVSARQFSRIPGRAYDIMARRVKVPTNYDPIAGTYSGVWDGTFKVAWTNNPAWVYYDMATDTRAGVGHYIKPQHLDKWALYSIGRYCDVRVPDGNGGTEPRFTCNLYLQTPVQARQALQDLAALFRAISFWGNGQIAVVQDAPSDPVALFTKANIVGEFAYESVSRKTRHSVWTVYYNDLTQLGRRTPAVYVDKELVKALGVVNETFSPIGCTSRGQAMRLARWAAYSEAAGRTVMFTAGPQAVSVGPGHVIKIADPNKAGKRLGGRVRSATVTAVTLDAVVTLEAGQTYQLEVMMPDTALQLGYRTEKRQVTTGVGATQTLTVSPPFSVEPMSSTVWVLQPTNIQPTWWRVINRGKPAPGTNTYQVLAIQHDADKYDAIELGLKLAPKPTSGLSVIAPQVASIELTESAYLDGPTPRIRANVSWPEPAPGLRYVVSWKLNNGPTTVLPQTSANAVDLDGLQVGALVVDVRTVNAIGRTSAATTATLTLAGKLLPPAAPIFGTAVTLPGLVRIPYTACPDSDYDTTLLRVGATFATSTPLPGEGDRTGYDWRWPGVGTFTVWGQFRDSTGNLSAPASTVVAVDAAKLRAGASTLMIKINYSTFSHQNYNECYLHGRDATGAPADVPGYVMLNGAAVEAPNGPLLSGQAPAAGYIVWDSSSSLFAGASGDTHYVMARRYQGRWQYDNNAAWIDFTPTASHYIIGTIESGAGDTGDPGTPPGIIAASIWAAPSTLTALVATADAAYAAAATAQSAADAAATNATAALARQAIIDSNGYYDRGEKPEILKRYLELLAEKDAIYGQGTTYDVLTERNAYNTAFGALVAYLNGLSPTWSDTSADTPIVPAIDQATWNAVYTARTALLKRINDVLAMRANWGAVADRPSDDSIRNNLIDLSWWVKQDATIPWGLNGEYNRIVSASPAGGGGSALTVSGPKGGNDILWYCAETTNDGNAGGGWNYAPISLDTTKPYRFVVPIRRLNGSAGTMYWGTGNIEMLDGSANTNPYFCATRPGYSDRWYLFVGYIYPAGSTGNTSDSAGVWDCKTGAKIAAGTNFRFQSGVGGVYHRAYQYYASNLADQVFGRPCVNLVDGTEPSLREYFEPGAVLNSALVPSITAAQAAADTAQGTANSAATGAASALGTLATMRSNGFLDASEKPALIKAWLAIYNEYAGIIDNANRYSIVAKRDDYAAAFTSLSNYLGSLAPSWDDATTDTPITPSTDQARWTELYYRRQVLLDYIAALAKSLISTAQGAADGAAAAAANAQSTANTAAGNATSALSTLATMRSNGYLDASEKPDLIRRWQSISDEKPSIYAQGTAFGITTERNDYATAYDNLAAYLTALSPSWNDTSSDTPITPATDQAKWASYYGARQGLLNKIAEVAATRANWAGIPTGTGKPLDYAGLVVDLGEGGSPGQREVDDPPSFYVTPGKYLQFKASGSIGLSGAEYWSTLETTKQYYTNGGGGKTTQYAYSGASTWRRTATSDTSSATWTAWVIDLDRNSYTGALDATSNHVFRQSSDPGGAAINGDSWQDTSTGKSYQRVGGAWQADVGTGSVGTVEIAANAVTSSLSSVSSNTYPIYINTTGIGYDGIYFTPPANCTVDVICSFDGSCVNSNWDVTGAYFRVFACPSSDLTTTVWGGNTRALGGSAVLGPAHALGTTRQAATMQATFTLTAGVQYWLGLAGNGSSPAPGTNIQAVVYRLTTDVLARNR